MRESEEAYGTFSLVQRNIEKFNTAMRTYHPSDFVDASSVCDGDSVHLISLDSDSPSTHAAGFRVSRSKNDSSLVVLEDVRPSTPASLATPPLSVGSVVRSINGLSVERTADVSAILKDSTTKGVTRMVLRSASAGKSSQRY